jgi:hypothetical protein
VVGRIFYSAKNRALRGFRRNAWPAALCRDRSAPLQKQIRNAFRRDLRPLAHFDAPLPGERVHNGPQIAP